MSKPKTRTPKSRKTKPTAANKTANKPSALSLDLKPDGLKLVDQLCKAWSDGLESQFKVGEIIDQLHQGYNRKWSYPALAETCRQRHSGLSLAPSTLHAYHKAYELYNLVKASVRSEISGLSHSHWIKAAVICTDLSLPAKVKLLQRAAKEDWPVAELRTNIIKASGDQQKAARDSEPVVLSGKLAKGAVSHCLAKDLIAQLKNKSVTLAVMDWQWTIGQQTKTEKKLPAVYPASMDVALADVQEAIRLIVPKLNKDGFVAVHGAATFEGIGFEAIRKALTDAGLVYDSVLVWDKQKARMVGVKGVSPSAEFIWLFRLANADLRPLGATHCVYAETSTTTPCHPFEKPAGLYAHLINAVVAQGHIVVDLFAGSGSCGAAAIATGRVYYGSEAVEAYAKMANERIARQAECATTSSKANAYKNKRRQAKKAGETD